MKIRTGFVSNSSSSSFICTICGEVESGWDVSLEDIEFVQCKNGHQFCESHLDDEVLEKMYDGYEGDTDDDEEDNNYEYFRYEISESVCPICRFDIVIESDIKKYLKSMYDVEESVVFEEVKRLNKRRKKLYDKEYINYVYKEKELYELDVIKEIKEKFNSYKEFKKYIKKNRGD